MLLSRGDVRYKSMSDKDICQMTLDFLDFNIEAGLTDQDIDKIMAHAPDCEKCVVEWTAAICVMKGVDSWQEVVEAYYNEHPDERPK